MNRETQKQTLLKVVVISGVACLGWMLLVKPVIQNINDQSLTIEAHKELVIEYRQRVGEIDSSDAINAEKELQGILDSMTGMSIQGDTGTSLHNLINESASNNGVSVTRIESVSANQLVQKIQGTMGLVKGIHNTARVEIEGDYTSVVSFMHEVTSGPIQVSFTSFRFVPTDVEKVRVNIEISSIMLTSIPSGSDLGEGNDEG